MADTVSLTISGLALAVSTVNAWLTLWRRGAVRMTQATVIFLWTGRAALPERGFAACGPFAERDASEFQHLGTQR
jgi:hypothetical protein